MPHPREKRLPTARNERQDRANCRSMFIPLLSFSLSLLSLSFFSLALLPFLSLSFSFGNKTMHGERMSKWRHGIRTVSQQRESDKRPARGDCACIIYCCHDTIILFPERPRLIIGGPRDHSALFRIYFHQHSDFQVTEQRPTGATSR